MTAFKIDSVDPAGFSCTSISGASLSVRWSDVESLSAFRPGHPGPTSLCIRHSGDRFPCYLDELDPKWGPLVAQIFASLPGCVPYESWCPLPIHPVLELNLRKVYPPDP